MKILLIAGHGAGDPGACSSYGVESDEARRVVSKLKALLGNYGTSVDVYPTGRNAYADIGAGNLQVNFANYDYVLEIHFNSSSNASATGVEVWVTNAESGVGVEQAICTKVSAVGFSNRGVKREDFRVIRNAKSKGVSAALVEVCFISNKNDMHRYNNSFNQVCSAIADGVAEGFGLGKPSQSTPQPSTPSPNATINYVVKDSNGKQLGAFNQLENAKSVCNSNPGTKVYDMKGTQVYPAVTTTAELYRVRTSWDNIKSQVGAYASLENAKIACDAHPGTKVYDMNGKRVYPLESTDNLYRVRKSWEDTKSQVGAYASLENAKKNCPAGYKVFDSTGNVVYTPSVSPTQPSTETKPSTPTKPTVTMKQTPIMGESVCTASQLIAFVKAKNPNFNEKIAEAFINVGKRYGMKGDIVFCQSVHETGWFKFGGDVKESQNNFAGIGATGNGNPGNTFATIEEGVTAQIQHLYAYACKDELKEQCVDPRFKYVTRGIAPNWEDLSGRWAVPGYPKSKYDSLESAYLGGETYAQLILRLHEEAQQVKVEPTDTQVLVGLTDSEILDKIGELLSHRVKK